MTPTTTVEVLEAAWALIEDPAHWTTGAYARDADGHEIDERDPHAVCWCAAGAVYKVCAPVPRGEHIAIASLIAHCPSQRGIGETNDDLGHDAVRAMYAAAIKAAREAQ